MFYCWRLTSLLLLLLLWEVLALLKNNIQDDLFACDLNGAVKTDLESFSVSNARKNETFYWSGCNLHKSQTMCPPNSLVCVKRPGAPFMEAISLGDSFELISNGSQIGFRSQSAVKCREDPSRKYTTYVSFDERRVEPYLQQTDDICSYNISLPNAKTEHICTIRLGAFLLDFRDLQNDFQVSSNGNTFVFNLCQSPRQCKDGVSTCVSGSRNENLAFSATRRITYEEENAKVEFHFTNGVRKGKGRLDTNIELNCDWNKLYGIPTYLPTSSWKTTKFALDTSLACVKLPMNCKFLGIDKCEYDLSVLYKSDGSWIVNNQINKMIRMNICGPLKDRKEDCRDREAQICEAIEHGEDISYGGILIEKRVEDGILKAKLSHGSVCPGNRWRTLSTNLSFVCSFTEKGPRLLYIKDCSAEIVWETPAACPKFTVTSKTLNIHDNLGQRNLMDLCGHDRKHLLDQNTYILYNLCAPLSTLCDGLKNASACLKGGRDFILGFYRDEKLFSRNSILTMELTGESSGRLNVSFACDYDAPVEGQASVRTIRDYSVYSMVIKSPGACVTKINHLNGEGTHCTLTDGTNSYNLSGLALSDENYRYVNKQNGIEYILNICKPVVTDMNTLCARNSGVCIQNRTEPNFKNRFRVAGSYPGKLKIMDGQLVFHLSNGYVCSKGEFASTIIRFVCTDIEEDPSPKLISATDCSHNFLWRTRHACPLLDNDDEKPPSFCMIPKGGDTSLQLTAVQQKMFQFIYENRTNVTFDICSDFYTETYVNGTSIRSRAIRTADRDSITVTVQNNCNNTPKASWNKLKILLVCDENGKKAYEIIAVENCTVYLRCNSRAFCGAQHHENYEIVNNDAPSDSGIFELAIKKFSDILERALTSRISKSEIESPNPSPPPPPHTTTRRTTTTTTISNSKTDEIAKVCTFKVNKTVINLSDLVPVRINSDSGSHYTIAERSCKGYVCKDVVPLASLRTCPNISEEGSQVRMLFNNTWLADKPFTTVMILKCNVTAEEPHVNNETDTSLTLSYPFEKLCPPPETKSSAGSWITAVILLLLAVVSASGGCWWWYKRKKKPYSFLRGVNKAEMYLYARDTQT